MRAIDGEALIDWIDPGHLRHPSELCFSELDVVNMINHAPTIESERKGMWLHGKEVAREVCGTVAIVHYDGWKCSLCDCLVEQVHVPTYKFCPNCGADMRGEE